MLYVCATPIGNLGDITLRVLDTLRSVDLVAAEDTRRTRKLLTHFAIRVPIVSLYAHNEAARTQQVLARLEAGEQVALVTDAGLPGVSDPGARLVAATLKRGLPMTVLPGPSAPPTALVASGLGGDGSFCFVGYLPRRTSDLQAAWRRWRAAGELVVAFESPRRLARSLHALAQWAPDVPAAVCRELTKLHEEVVRGTVSELAERYAGTTAERCGGPAAERCADPTSAAAADVPWAAGRAARGPVTTGPAGAAGGAVVQPGGVGGEVPPGRVRGEVTLVLAAGAAADNVSAGEAEEVAELSGTAARLLAKGLSKRDAAAALAVCLNVRRRDAERIVRAAADRLVDSSS